MSSSMQIKSIDDPERHATEVVKPLLVGSDKEHEEAPVLLKVLVLGSHEIEQNQFRSSDEVFAELDQEDTSSTSA